MGLLRKQLRDLQAAHPLVHEKRLGRLAVTAENLDEKLLHVGFLDLL
jgi:hypothetical protein